jgi:protein-tyrosine phosphatase
MIDLHCHVLPGVDDGPETLEASLDLARAAVAEGTRVLVATPHVNYRYPTVAATMLEAVERTNAALRDAGLPIEVAPGAEIAHDALPDLDDTELRALTLGGGPNLLLEAPLGAVGGDFEDAVAELQGRGFGVVLAHPERSPSFHRDTERLTGLVGRGALCSVTSSAFTGRFGKPVRQLAERLLAGGLVHDVASDAHDAERRPPLLRSPLVASERHLPGLSGHIAWLTEAAPATILSGEPLPARPPLPARRRARRLSWSR